ncbi:proteinase inhibitor I78 [Streptomyces sp. NPDC020917]|uniref:proteinase inhibitor I78 n=1 Tax=Streptomyces sp. NPDC020917 TaxID=3365102 RepID=UPI0037926E8E
MAPHASFPGDNPPDDLNAYQGMEQQQAERRARERGWTTVRSLPPDAVVTMEYVVGRLNFTIADGRVQRCWMG